MEKRKSNIKGNTIHVKTKLVDTFLKMKIGGFTEEELRLIGKEISRIIAEGENTERV